VEDFSKARNYAFSKATMDYIMWLDADDVINDSERKKLINLKNSMNNNIDIIMLKYNISFDYNNSVLFSYYRERILKRSMNYKWIDRVHEYIPLKGNIKKMDIAIEHRKTNYQQSDRNIKIYRKMEEEKIKFTPRNLYYYGRELSSHGMFKEAISILNKFLNSNKGWKDDNINACIVISECYDALGKKDKSLESLLRSFKYDIPRSKICCLIAEITDDIYNKIYWYEQAINNAHSLDSFYERDYDIFIPAINLCFYYYNIGDKGKSKKYHVLSKKEKPYHPSVIYNENYFSNLTI
jgi:glycosyltransferase involved in cell wall biosynthesis